MSRRLPVYLVLDISGSMTGAPITAVESGLSLLKTSLLANPQALETVHMNVITFSDKADQTSTMEDLSTWIEPTLNAHGTTSLGAALTRLAQSIESDVQKASDSARGDWKPLVFLMTDGQPTDDWEAGARSLTSLKFGAFAACAAGAAADTRILQQLADMVNAPSESKAVVQLSAADGTSLEAFFKWVSASISITSVRKDQGLDEGALSTEDAPEELTFV